MILPVIHPVVTSVNKVFPTPVRCVVISLFVGWVFKTCCDIDLLTSVEPFVCKYLSYRQCFWCVCHLYMRYSTLTGFLHIWCRVYMLYRLPSDLFKLELGTKKHQHQGASSISGVTAASTTSGATGGGRKRRLKKEEQEEETQRWSGLHTPQSWQPVSFSLLWLQVSVLVKKCDLIRLDYNTL